MKVWLIAVSTEKGFVIITKFDNDLDNQISVRYAYDNRNFL